MIKLKLEGVGRCDRGTHRLQDITYSCESGKVVGLIGNNGAGKTTLLRLLAGQLAPTSGKILFEAGDAAGNDRASCIDLDSGYPNMTGHEMMRYIAAVNGVSDEDLLRKLETEWGVPTDKKTADYSLGMKVRLNLAMTMLKSPQILLLDEVFNGLDPSGQRDCRNILTDYARQDHLVIISSHSLYDIAEMSDEIIFLDKGRITRTLKEHTDVHELAAYFEQNKGESNE